MVLVLRQIHVQQVIMLMNLQKNVKNVVKDVKHVLKKIFVNPVH